MNTEKQKELSLHPLRLKEAVGGILKVKAEPKKQGKTKKENKKG